MKLDANGPPIRAELPDTRAKPKKPPPERHRWLDQWMVARGEPLRKLVQIATRIVDHYEDHYRVRARARRADDLAKHRTMI